MVGAAEGAKASPRGKDHQVWAHQEASLQKKGGWGNRYCLWWWPRQASQGRLRAGARNVHTRARLAPSASWWCQP